MYVILSERSHTFYEMCNSFAYAQRRVSELNNDVAIENDKENGTYIEEVEVKYVKINKYYQYGFCDDAHVPTEECKIDGNDACYYCVKQGISWEIYQKMKELDEKQQFVLAKGHLSSIETDLQKLPENVRNLSRDDIVSNLAITNKKITDSTANYRMASEYNSCLKSYEALAKESPAQKKTVNEMREEILKMKAEMTVMSEYNKVFQEWLILKDKKQMLLKNEDALIAKLASMK